MSSSELENRKQVVHKYITNPELTSVDIAKQLKLNKRTVQKILKRYKETLTIERAHQSGRKPGPSNKELAKTVAGSFKANPGLSIRDRARRYGVSKSTIFRWQRMYGYKSFRLIKQPNRTDKQNLVAKKRARKLYDSVLTNFGGCVLMDDETYVKCDFRQLPAHRYYSAIRRGNVANKFKFLNQDKFAKKLLIWQALCSCGRKSRAFITPRTLNSEIYIKKCLNERLLPLIRQHASRPKFWPDLASCHYARSTMEWYEANNVDVVAKEVNPPNCPQLRPIEKYWATVKRKLNKTGGASRNVQEMYRKWNKAATEVTPEAVRTSMGSIKTKVRKFLRNQN